MEAADATQDGVPWPRISIVTPSYNQGRFIKQAIQSVISQEYPNIEYVIVDGASTDTSVQTIRKFEGSLSWWVSERDEGMYHALNKGFARTTGEVMGWLNCSDILYPGALTAIGSIFRAFPTVEWVTGVPVVLNEQGSVTFVSALQRWSRLRFLLGAHRWIYQVSTFWRRSLWERAGGFVDPTWSPPADYELWVRFFRHAQLYSVNTLVGAYRLHEDSLSNRDPGRLHALINRMIETELKATAGGRLLGVLRKASDVAQGIPKVRALWWWLLVRRLYSLPGPDWPPIIEYRDGRWALSK